MPEMPRSMLAQHISTSITPPTAPGLLRACPPVPPAAPAGGAADGSAPGVVRPSEVRVVSNADGTIDLLPTAAAAAAAAAKKAEEQAERDKVGVNGGPATYCISRPNGVSRALGRSPFPRLRTPSRTVCSRAG